MNILLDHMIQTSLRKNLLVRAKSKMQASQRPQSMLEDKIEDKKWNLEDIRGHFEQNRGHLEDIFKNF